MPIAEDVLGWINCALRRTTVVGAITNHPDLADVWREWLSGQHGTKDVVKGELGASDL